MVLCITPRSPTGSGDPLGRVVCADLKIGTLRAETFDPRQGLTKTASLDGGRASDREFTLVPTLPIGADVPSCVVAVTRAPIRGGSVV